MSTWRTWAPKRLHEFETSVGSTLGVKLGQERRSAKVEYENAIKGMTEEEEIEYVRNKYGGEIQWDDDDAKQIDEGGDAS